jgi:hypothetical protein
LRSSLQSCIRSASKQQPGGKGGAPSDERCKQRGDEEENPPAVREDTILVAATPGPSGVGVPPGPSSEVPLIAGPKRSDEASPGVRDGLSRGLGWEGSRSGRLGGKHASGEDSERPGAMDVPLAKRRRTG